jgi:hypothetical protein
MVDILGGVEEMRMEGWWKTRRWERKGKKGQTRYQTWRGCMDVDGAGGMWKCGNVGTLKGPGGRKSRNWRVDEWGNITKGKHERERE